MRADGMILVPSYLRSWLAAGLTSLITPTASIPAAISASEMPKCEQP